MVLHEQIPQFTNPTDITKIGAIATMENIDVIEITFANDQCASFNCPTVSCTSDGNKKFVYDTGKLLNIDTVGVFACVRTCVCACVCVVFLNLK